MATVLLVEDDQGVRDMLTRAFTHCGWNIRSAATPDEAREIARVESFDLILCDVMLPQTNGVRLVEQLRELQPHASATFISGYPERYLQDRTGAEFGLPLLQKPFTFKALLGRAARLTTGRPAATLPSFDVI